MSTLVRKNNSFPSTSFFDDFLTRNLFDWSNWTQQGTTIPQVNILETNDEFRVEMAAPGMKKEDFHVSLDNDTLTIQSELSNEESQSENQRYALREFNYHSFKRSFYLPNTIEVDKIKAKYKDGMLHLVIPKKEEARRKPVKTIAIS